MGILNIFKKNSNKSTENGVQGPLHLDDFSEHINNPKKLESFEWRRKIVSKTGQSRFRIKYFGEQHTEYKNLIVATDIAPVKIVAIDSSSDEEILLFDGCLHGYDALFCETYTNEVLNRKAQKIYRAKNRNEVFELVVSTYYQIEYDDEEFASEVDTDGKIELNNGKKIDFDVAKRNGFDVIQVLAITDNGKRIEIVSEELS